MSRNWVYDWVISCPTVVKLGIVHRGNYRGVATLALTLPRVVILGGRGGLRLINRVPDYLDGGLIEKICLNIARGMGVEGFIEEAFYRTMFYGGFNVYLTDDSGSLNILTYELVDTTKLFFYIKEGGGFETQSSIENLVLLGLGLRTGIYGYVREACRGFGGLINDVCVVSSGKYVVLISNKPLKDNGYLRVFPDNNPLRHVIKL